MFVGIKFADVADGCNHQIDIIGSILSNAIPTTIAGKERTMGEYNGNHYLTTNTLLLNAPEDDVFVHWYNTFIQDSNLNNCIDHP